MEGQMIGEQRSPTRIRRFWSQAAMALAVALGSLLGATSAGRLPAAVSGVPSQVSSAAGPTVAPTVHASLPMLAPTIATTAFLTAYARADETAADRQASPLYRVEWERRGLSAQVRERLDAPSRQAGEPAHERLHFTFVAGVLDAGGFGHLLYAAHSTQADRPVLWSAWRVDTDPDGRVIWLELAWLFGGSPGALRPVLDPEELYLTPIPPTQCCARPLFGVASADGREAYYALAVGVARTELPITAQPAVVRFYAVDSDGNVRHGGWTYGRDGYEPVEYGRRQPKAPSVGVPREQVPLLEGYLRSLD